MEPDVLDVSEAGGGGAEDVAIVVVTHRRPDMLRVLLHSIAEARSRPGYLVVIDNASGDDTPQVVEEARPALGATRLHYRRLDENVGGAGGFNEGVRTALEAGAQWFWLMDDDVALHPQGLARLLAHAGKRLCLMGQREDHRGRLFFFQNVFVPSLGVALPRPGDIFSRGDAWPTNLATFEGLFVHRSVVERIGLPDPRFFITWDDLVYGWLASHVTEVACVRGVVLRRIRRQRQISLGLRHLSEASDLSRYYMMRNRGLLAQYLRHHGAYNACLFPLGTLLVLGKELLRLFVVERRLRGLGALMRGMREARRIARAPDWQPMPPLRASI